MRLNTRLVAEVAAAAETTARTVERRMLGLSIRGDCLQARIDRELAARGLTPGQIYAVTSPSPANPPPADAKPSRAEPGVAA